MGAIYYVQRRIQIFKEGGDLKHIYRNNPIKIIATKNSFL